MPQLATQQTHGLMDTLRDLAQRFHLPTTLLKFMIVGGCGFLINLVVLFLIYDAGIFAFLPDKHTRVDLGLFHHPDILLLIGSIVAVEAAILFQFNAHERWTFRNRHRQGWIGTRLLKFNLSSAVSPIMIVTTINILTPVFGLSPYISSMFGVLMGFTWNWVLNTVVIWPQHKADAAVAK